MSIEIDLKVEQLPGKRGLPYLGYNYEDPKTKKAGEHPNVDEFKQQVDEDLNWAFEMAKKAVEKKVKDLQTDFRDAIKEAQLALRVFDEIRQYRWRCSPGDVTVEESVEFTAKGEPRLTAFGKARFKKLKAAADREKPGGDKATA